MAGPGGGSRGGGFGGGSRGGGFGGGHEAALAAALAVADLVVPVASTVDRAALIIAALGSVITTVRASLALVRAITVTVAADVLAVFWGL